MLLEKMHEKYPNKKLVFVKDNLWAHKNTLTYRLMQDRYTKIIFTPSNTPEFSPIENMFSYIKKKLRHVIYQKKEQVAMIVAEAMFSQTSDRIKGFFRRTLSNMLRFWLAM